MLLSWLGLSLKNQCNFLGLGRNIHSDLLVLLGLLTVLYTSLFGKDPSKTHYGAQAQVTHQPRQPGLTLKCGGVSRGFRLNQWGGEGGGGRLLLSLPEAERDNVAFELGIFMARVGW